MEPLASESVFFESFLVRFFVSIDFVPDDRISYRWEVDTYLVCATCEEVNLEECVFIREKSLIAKFRFSEFWVHGIHRRHFFPIVRISSDIWLDISLVIFYFSYDEGEIGFFDSSFCYLELECMHGTIIFGYHDDSTRILIETMNNSRFLYAIYYRTSFFRIILCTFVAKSTKSIGGQKTRFFSLCSSTSCIRLRSDSFDPRTPISFFSSIITPYT